MSPSRELDWEAALDSGELKEYFEKQISANRELMLALSAKHEREHQLLAQATELARGELDRRLEGMNAFRAQIERAESVYITRNEWASGHEALLREVQRIAGVQVEVKSTMATFAELNRTVKEHGTADEVRFEALDNRMRAVGDTVAKYTGGVAVLSFLLSFIVWLLKK